MGSLSKHDLNIECRISIAEYRSKVSCRFNIKKDRAQRIHTSTFEIPCSIFDIQVVHLLVYVPPIFIYFLLMNLQLYVFENATRPPRPSAAICICLRAGLSTAMAGRQQQPYLIIRFTAEAQSSQRKKNFV